MPSSCNYVYSTQYYTQRMRERVWETSIIYTPMFSKIGLITPIPSRCLVEQRTPPHIMKLTDNNVEGYVVFGNEDPSMDIAPQRVYAQRKKPHLIEQVI